MRENFSEATSIMMVNKLRTVLAALGIVIGIASVIALISLGQGSQKAVENQIKSLGANLLTVMPGGQTSGGVRGAAGGGTSLTLDDAKAIASSNRITTVVGVSPELSRRAQVTTGSANTNTQIIGVWPEYATIHKLEMETGVFVTQTQVDSLAKVAVLGPQTAEDLFGETSTAVGQSIRINGQNLRVVGVVVSKGGSGFQNPDDAIYVPLATAQKQLFGVTSLSSVAIEAKSEEVMTQAQDEIGYLLLERHKLTDPTQADFLIFSQNDILNTASQVTGTFTTLLSGIAAISLLVGGIGIMNIMLVTVTERTREIGLRKALGAKRKVIIQQFLTEAVILTFVGGLAGTGLGLVISWGLSKVINIPFAVEPSAILLASGVSIAIGILFGWYPAQKAAKLQPIEALRYE